MYTHTKYITVFKKNVSTMFFRRTSSKTKQNKQRNKQTNKPRHRRNVHRIVTAVGMSLNAVFWLSYGSAAAAASADDDDEKYCNTNLLSPPLPSPSLTLSLSLSVSLHHYFSCSFCSHSSRWFTVNVIRGKRQTDRQTV